MTPDEAYEEALRRIHEAEETGAVELDLSGWNKTIGEYSGLEGLNRLPPELERLISLHSLDLSYCKHLSGDLAPLSSLTSLQTLDLGQCEHIRDLAPLAKLTSLQSLNLHRCDDLCCDLSPLAGLTSLKSLDLSGCDQLRGDLTPLTNLASLQSLNLGWSDQLTADLSPLAGLTSLQWLDLSRTDPLAPFFSSTISSTTFPRWPASPRSSGWTSPGAIVSPIFLRPLPGQMLLCSSFKASAIRARNAYSIRPPKWTIFHFIASPRSAHVPD
jgi:hypothetical protein